MESDNAIEDDPDESGVNDIDSLASTAESEQASEYAVEDILAERNIYMEPDSDDSDGEAGDVTQFLVKWLGYPMDRCSWEPKEQFDTEETLSNWETTKQLIAEGKKEVFNVEQWNRYCAMLAKKTAQRKKERRRKREQRAQQQNNPLTFPDQPEASSSEPRRAHRLLSTDPFASALLVHAEPPPTMPKQAASRQLRQQQGPERSTTPAPQASPEKSSRTSRLAQVAKDITAKHKALVPEPSNHPKCPESARPALSGFGVGPGSKAGSRAKARWDERAPGFSETTKIMKPTDFAPRTMMKDNTLAMALATHSKLGESQNQIADESPTSMASSPEAHSGLTDPLAARQPAEPPAPWMASPAPRSLNFAPLASVSSAHSNVHLKTNINNSASPPGSLGPIYSPVIPTGPRAEAESISTAKLPSFDTNAPHVPTHPRSFIHPERFAMIRKIEGRDNPDSSNSSTDIFGRSEISRPSSPFGRSSPPRRRSPLSRRSSPSRWKSPPRRSLSRRVSPSRRRSPSRSPPRRPSHSRRSSRRPPNKQFPKGGDSWRPRSSSPIYSQRIAAESLSSGTLIQPKLSREAQMGVASVRGHHGLSPDYSRPIASESSAEARMARMPVRAIPNVGHGHRGLMFVGDHWWDNTQDEALMHIYFGPEKRYIGPVRLCGIYRHVKKDLIVSGKSKRSNRLEVWFRHLCTAAEFERLSTPSVSFDSHYLSVACD
jgi:hypothetical protein